MKVLFPPDTPSPIPSCFSNTLIVVMAIVQVKHTAEGIAPEDYEREKKRLVDFIEVKKSSGSATPSSYYLFLSLFLSLSL